MLCLERLEVRLVFLALLAVVVAVAVAVVVAVMSEIMNPSNNYYITLLSFDL